MKRSTGQRRCIAVDDEDFRRRALVAVSDEVSGPVRWFVLNTEANVELDLIATDALDQLCEELTRCGVSALAHVKQDLRDDLEAAGLVGKVGEKRIFPTLPTAVSGDRDWVAARS